MAGNGRLITSLVGNGRQNHELGSPKNGSGILLYCAGTDGNICRRKSKEDEKQLIDLEWPTDSYTVSYSQIWFHRASHVTWRMAAKQYGHEHYYNMSTIFTSSYTISCVHEQKAHAPCMHYVGTVHRCGYDG